MTDPIKLTNQQVLASAQALVSLSRLKLPAKAAYAIAKAAKKMAEIETTVREVQKALWEKYGEKDEAGKLKVNEANSTITIPPGQRDAYEKEMAGLMAEINELGGLRTVALGELGNVQIEPATFGPLDWFIKDE